MGSSSPENVSNLIAKPEEKYPPEPRYVSKYRKQIIDASKQGKSDHKTMGMPVMDSDMPVQYLKKRSTPKSSKKLPVGHQLRRRYNHQSELVAEKLIKQTEFEKRRIYQDFAMKNAEEARKLRLNKTRRGLFCVDDRFGNSYPVMASGMFPVYRNRECFGKVPGTYPPPLKTLSKHERESSLIDEPTAEFGKLKKNDTLKSSPRRSRSPGKIPQLEKKYHEMKGRGKSPKAVTRKNRAIENTPKVSRKIEQSRGITKKKSQENNAKTDHRQVDSIKKEPTKPTDVGGTGISADESGKALKKDDQVTVTDSSSWDAKNNGGRKVENDKRENSESSTSEAESKDGRESEESYVDTETTISSKSEKSETSTSRITIPYQKPRCRYVTEDERAELLNGMKKKWDDMMNKFQCLPFVTDTQPKMKRKSYMERKLLNLEKDIKTIEQHPYIYVYSDSED